MIRVALLLSFLIACTDGSIEFPHNNGSFDARRGSGFADSGSGENIDGGRLVDAASLSDAAPVVGEPSALRGITAAHNQARAAKGVGPMTWDNDLAAIAQAWVDRCVFEHNDGRSANYPGYVGENLYASDGLPSGQSVVNLWVSEEPNYNYEENNCTGVCGHYTQVVWANSIRLGCAVSDCPNGQWRHIVACDYSPGGNFGGARPY